METTIEDRMAIIERALDSVVDGEYEIGNLTTAVAQLLKIVRTQQAEIERLTRESDD